MKRVWDNASVRKAKNLNKDEFFFGCRNVAMAQIGNNLQNINSLSFINSNNSIPLPQFGVNYVPPTTVIGNNTAPNNDDDDFISIEEDQDKAIKPQESIHQAELNLVNSLMKEFSVTDAIEEKKKNEEMKRKQEEEEKKKKELELQKKNEESKPKKNLDDLFNLLDNLPKEEPKPTTPITPQETQLNPSIQEAQIITENKKEIEDDEFISIEEENIVNEKKNNQDKSVNEIKDDKTEAEKREDLDGIDFVEEVNNAPKAEEKIKNNLDSNIIENNKKPTLDELMNAFQVTGNNDPVQQEEPVNKSVPQEKKEENEKEQNEEINDDDFCEVEEDTNNENNEISLNNNNNNNQEQIRDKKEIISIPNVQIPIVENIIEVPVEKKEEVKEEPKEEEKKPSILNLSPLDFLQEFKKEIEPTSNTNSNFPNDNKDNNEDNQFEFVQEDEQDEGSNQVKEILSPSEKLLSKNFKTKELKAQFISNLKKILETLTNEITKNIPLLKKLLPYSEKLKISKNKLTLTSNLKLVNYLNGIIYLLLDYTTLWNTKNFLNDEMSKKASVFGEVLNLIKEISKGENFKQIFKEDALNKLNNLDKEKFVTKDNEKDCLLCLQNLNKEGNTNVFGYDFHINCVNIWLNLIESNSPYKLT